MLKKYVVGSMGAITEFAIYSDAQAAIKAVEGEVDRLKAELAEAREVCKRAYSYFRAEKESGCEYNRTLYLLTQEAALAGDANGLNKAGFIVVPIDQWETMMGRYKP